MRSNSRVFGPLLKYTGAETRASVRIHRVRINEFFYCTITYTSNHIPVTLCLCSFLPSSALTQSSGSETSMRSGRPLGAFYKYITGALRFSVGLTADSPRGVRGYPEAIGIHGRIECRTAFRGVRCESETVNRSLFGIFQCGGHELHKEDSVTS